MAYCATSLGTSGSPPVFQIQTAAQNPADLSTCPFVFMQGSEYGMALQLSKQEGQQEGQQSAQTGTSTISTVTQLQIKAEELNPERIQDMMEMFWLFVLALIGVWGSKQLLNLFSTDSDKD